MNSGAAVRALVVAGFALALVGGCSDGGDGAPVGGDDAQSSSPSPPDQRDFAEVVSLYEGDIEVFESPAELASAAELVVRGSVASVDEGRTIFWDVDNVPDYSTRTVVLAVNVSKVLKGAVETERMVYVEIQLSGAVDLEDLHDASPNDAILFLSAVDAETVGEGSEVIDPGAGRPQDAALHGAWPAGFLYESGGTLKDHMVDIDELGEGWNDLSTLDDIEAAILG